MSAIAKPADHPQNSAEALALIREISPAMQRVLSCIGIGEDGGHGQLILRALERRGLIEGHAVAVAFEDGLPPMLVMRYEVPVFVHIAWCEWCAELPEEETHRLFPGHDF